MRISTDRLPLEASYDGARVQRATWAGTAVRVLRLPPGADLGPATAKSPDELCPSSHWGYVLEGSIEVRFAFGERESVRAGELYYWPALHTCWTDEGVRLLEFSPAAELDPSNERASTRGGA
jgi:hypothetical protein